MTHIDKRNDFWPVLANASFDGTKLAKRMQMHIKKICEYQCIACSSRIHANRGMDTRRHASVSPGRKLP
jgi:hypothetical protein